LTVDHVKYTAPFDGVITSLPSKRAENVFANVPMLILVDLSDRYIVVSLEQQGALRVLIGQAATLSFDTMREFNFVGTVKSIYSNATNFLARINISNFPAKILPGMTADVAITIATHQHALLLPVAALEGGKFVWIKGVGAKKVELKIGIVDKAYAEVLSGDIKEGDRVLIRKQAGP
jgi:multidrug efflux pump subunit AcrA (membrane-fusion protein)